MSDGIRSGRELDPAELEAEGQTERAHEQRLGGARHALEQHVARGRAARRPSRESRPAGPAPRARAPRSGARRRRRGLPLHRARAGADGWSCRRELLPEGFHGVGGVQHIVRARRPAGHGRAECRAPSVRAESGPRREPLEPGVPSLRASGAARARAGAVAGPGRSAERRRRARARPRARWRARARAPAASGGGARSPARIGPNRTPAASRASTPTAASCSTAQPQGERSVQSEVAPLKRARGVEAVVIFVHHDAPVARHHQAQGERARRRFPGARGCANSRSSATRVTVRPSSSASRSATGRPVRLRSSVSAASGGRRACR